MKSRKIIERIGFFQPKKGYEMLSNGVVIQTGDWVKSKLPHYSNFEWEPAVGLVGKKVGEGVWTHYLVCRPKKEKLTLFGFDDWRKEPFEFDSGRHEI